MAWRLQNVGAAFAESFIAAIEALDEIRNGSTEMAQRPADSGKPIRNPAEDDLRRGQSRVHQKTDQWHKPEIGHSFDTQRMRGVDIEHRPKIVGRFIKRPEARLVQTGAVDVAEEHRSPKSERPA